MVNVFAVEVVLIHWLAKEIEELTTRVGSVLTSPIAKSPKAIQPVTCVLVLFNVPVVGALQADEA